MSENALSRAIVLGLALVSGGTHALAAPPNTSTEAFDAGDLAGLVAIDGDFAGLGEGTAGEGEDGAPAGTCPGPSGCVADLILSTLALSPAGSLDRVTTAGVVVVQNSGFSGLAAENVRLLIHTSSSATIVGDGCQPGVGNSVECALDSLGIGERTAFPFMIEPVSLGNVLFVVTTTVSWSQPDPNPGDNQRASSVQVGSFGQPRARMTQVDASACPFVRADVSVTDRSGTPFDGPVPGPGFLDVFDEGQWAGSPLAFDPDLEPSSVVFLLDNSSSVDPARLDAHKTLVSQAAAAWHQQAVSAGWPLPAFAAGALTDAGGPGDFSSDPAVLASQLASIQPTGEPSRLYDALLASTTLLAPREGRRALVPFIESGDRSGSVLADPLRSQLSPGVPVYPVVSRPDLEQLARRIAEASSGFRHVSLGNDGAALADALGAIRRQSRLAWVAPAGGDPLREAVIRYTPGLPQLPHQANGFYSQADTPCARPCLATRSLPVFGSDNTTQVRLTIDPGNQTLDFSLRETLPSGLTVTAISDGGYLASQGVVRWDGKSISAPVEFTYTAHRPGFPAPGAFLNPPFKGALSTGGAALFPTCGDSLPSLVPRHPADVEAAGRILPVVVRAYADTWRRGRPWIDGISPIPIAHLTRAGQIQAGDGLYARRAAQVPWVLDTAPPLPYVVMAQRSVPTFYVPGETVAVALQIQPHSAGVYGAVEEHVPGGWDVVAIGQDGVFDPEDGVIRWGPFQDNQTRTLDYTVLAPTGASQAVTLTGFYSVDGDQQAFAGQGTLGNALLDPLFADDFE